jgi:hypothetical protein
MAARNTFRNPHGSKPRGWFKRCMTGVKKSGGAVDPAAVCGAIEARGKRGKLNPLPLALAQAGESSVLAPYQKQATKAAQRLQKKLGLKFNGAKRRRNPKNPAESASELYEGFHGKPSEVWVEIVTPIHEHKYLSALGELVSLDIISPTGARVTVKGFELRDKPALLCSNEKRSQMFIEGGDQRVDLKAFGIREPIHEQEELGELNALEYYTIKKHLGKEGGEAIYRHKLKAHKFRRKPVVLYDTVNHLISFAGGNYSVLDEGIDN